jgi:diacylglycerol kinase (ATP)
MDKDRRFKFIVNPVAGRGKTRGIDTLLHRLLKEKKISYHIQTTSQAYEAISIAKEATKSFDVVVAVGGDGTSNEVANGVIGTKATLGVIPAGSGNDFAKVLGMRDSVEESVHQVISGPSKRIDSGTVKVEDQSAIKSSRKFVNSIGIGFDAIVAYEAQRIKHLKGIPLYLLAIVRSLQKLRPHQFHATFDGKIESGNYTLVCVGNGNREGGGFFVTPTANPSDGVFQVCTVKKVGLLRALRILPTILKGEHGKFSEVGFFDSKSVDVGSKDPFVVHCDGEILGVDSARVEIEINPNSLSVVHG